MTMGRGQDRPKPPGGGSFTTTHWSVVLAATRDSSPAAQQTALEQLCRTYWFPLYAYVRQKGHTPEDAQDLTQEFFAHFLNNRSALARADRERGRFRTYLLTCLQNFLRHEWERAQAEKRGGGRFFIPWHEEAAEERYRLELNEQLAPDQLFDQRWALTVFQNALARLEAESAAGGKGSHFEELKGFLASDPSEGAYARAASRLGLSAGAVAVAVHRLRRRYAELAREEIAHTVATPAQVEEEMRYLIELVST